MAGKPLLEQVLDEFYVCELLRRAYKFAFTHANISKAFKETGVFPLNAGSLFMHTRPLSHDIPDQRLSMDTMCQLLHDKRGIARTELLYKPQILESGFIDSTNGVF